MITVLPVRISLQSVPGTDRTFFHILFRRNECPSVIETTLKTVGTGVPDCPTQNNTAAEPTPDSGYFHKDGPFDLPSGVRIDLTPYGITAAKYLKQMNDFYDQISVDSYVIMPNHIHIMLTIHAPAVEISCGQSGTPVPTMDRELVREQERIAKSNSVYSRFVSTFKRFCGREYGENIWQERSFDHVIRSYEDYRAYMRYIYENPVRWRDDELYSTK